MSDRVYVLLRKNEDCGYGYDYLYPVEAVFRSVEDAQQYRDNLIKRMRENDWIDKGTDTDEMFEIMDRLFVDTENDNV